MKIPGIELRFHPKERTVPSWFEDREEKPKCPCFMSRGTHVFSDKIEYDAEAYQFYYRYNWAIGLGGIIPRSSLLGYHLHDVEGIIVLFDKHSQEPRHVYYKAHGFGQGVWRKWEECEKSEDGSLVAYVARGSHAMYPSSTRVRRILGLANDQVSRDGASLIIQKSNVVEATNFRFARGIKLKDEVPKIPNTSISIAQRIFFPFMSCYVRRSANRSLNI
eukprot:g7143.t1